MNILLRSCLLIYSLVSCMTPCHGQASFPFRGSLIIIGGGDIPDTVYQIFAQKIGGKDQSIVYIPTASEDEPWIREGKHLDKFTSRGFTNLKTVHTRSKTKANEAEFPDMIRNAKGIFLGGGDQENLARIYGGTATHKAMLELLERGGVIMGTSAGATIMGSLLIGGDHRKKPNIPVDLGEGFSFMKQTAIDQHVLARNRQFDLIPVLEKYPNTLGIALDESTAALVEGDSITVVGESYMLIFDQHDWSRQVKEWGRVYQPFKIFSPGIGYQFRKN
jgi:cyanophycinase